MQKKLLMAAILAAAFCLSNVTWASNWDGSHSSDWRDLNNWSANALPAAGANWEILASTPHRLIVTDSFLDGTVTGRLIARDGFTITSGGSMSVAQLQHLGNPSHTPTLIQGTLNSAPGGSTASFWRVGTWTIDGGVLRVDRRMEFGTVSGTFTINVINGGRIEQMGTEFIITGNHSGGVTHVNITGANSRIINHDGGALPGSTARTLINRNNTAGRVTITNGGSWLMHETMARINTWIGNGWVRNNIPHEELVLTQIGNRVDVVGQRRTRAYNPSPAHGGSSAPGAVNLAWTKPLDSLLGTNVTSRVYFLENYPVDVNGLPTDPNGDTFPLIATMLPADAPSIMINTKPGARYGWRVDTMDNTLPANDPNTARIGRGQVWYFAIRNIAPVVEAGAMQRLGLNATGTATFNSNATVTDEGLPLGATVTCTWTQVNGPVTVTMPAPALMGNHNINLPLTVPGRYTFQLAANDTEFTGTDTVNVWVYPTECLAAQGLAGFTWNSSDINRDCRVDMLDLRAIAANWLACTDTLSPNCP